jgi:hypothetical protein
LAYGQTWLWGKQGIVGIKSNDHGSPLAVDKFGNATITGSYSNSITFGTVNMSNYSDGVFLAKYNSSGKLLWATQPNPAGGTNYAYSVATSKSSQIYICGVYVDSLIFSPYILTHSGNFIAKFDGSGNVLWTRSGRDSSGTSIAKSVSTYRSSNAFVTGFYKQLVIFGADTLKDPASVDNSVFLVDYDSNGNVAWARSGRSPNWLNPLSSSNGCAVDNNGNVYITGWFLDSIAFGPIGLFSSTVNTFLTKYDASGNALWSRDAKLPPASSSARGHSVATDNANNVYVAGLFTDSISFGSTKLVSAFSNSSVDEAFLVKYSPSGGVIWAKQSADSGVGTNPSVSTDDYGHVYLSYNATGLNPQFSGHPLTASADNSTFLIKLDSSGNILCFSSFGEMPYSSYTVASDSSGGYIYTSGVIDVKTIVFGPDTLKATGGGGPYVARWQPCAESDEGVNELMTNSKEVSVYPNPSKGVYAFEVKSEELRAKSVVEVYNMLGEKIYGDYQISKSSNYQIDLSTQPAGIYLYRVISENGELIGTGKLIKE